MLQESIYNKWIKQSVYSTVQSTVASIESKSIKWNSNIFPISMSSNQDQARIWFMRFNKPDSISIDTALQFQTNSKPPTNSHQIYVIPKQGWNNQFGWIKLEPTSIAQLPEGRACNAGYPPRHPNDILTVENTPNKYHIDYYRHQTVRFLFFFLERVRNIWAKVGLGPDPGRQIFVFLTPEWQLQLQTLDRNNQQPTASSQQTTSNNTCLPVNKSSARNAAQQHNHTSCASTSDLFPRLVRFDRMADPNRAHIHHQLGIRPNRINPIKTQFHQKQTIKLIRTINTRLDSVLIHLRSIQPIPVGSPVSIWWTDR